MTPDRRCTDPRLTLCRVEAPHFVAGFLVDTSRCRVAAPILAWTVGKHVNDLASTFRRKGWKCEGLAVEIVDGCD